MLITNLKLKNWRNFSTVDVPLGPRVYLIGANAAGKSNLLDVFRFLRTVAQSEGGGLQKAMKERGGIKKLRSLHARTDTEVRIEVEIAESMDEESERWRYMLAFKPEGKGKQRLLVTEESVWRGNTPILQRPEPADRKDTARLTQTFWSKSITTALSANLENFLRALHTCTWSRSCSSIPTRSAVGSSRMTRLVRDCCNGLRRRRRRFRTRDCEGSRAHWTTRFRCSPS